MPLYPVNDFLADFIQILECKKKINKKLQEKNRTDHQIQLDEFLRLANDSLGSDAIENKITVKALHHWFEVAFNIHSFSDNQIPDSCHPFGTAKQKSSTTNSNFEFRIGASNSERSNFN